MKKLAALTLAFMSASFCAGQTPLSPVWSHTWAFGQDTEPVPVGVGQDNHVTTDPSTGDVYLTIDDQLEQYSPHFDLLYRFTSGGLDLTPEPIPLLGSAVAGLGDPPNVESTRDLVMRNAVMYHARELNSGFGSGTVGILGALRPDGSEWRLGMGRGSISPPHGVVFADDAGVLVARTLGSEAGLHALTAEGWIQWSRSYPGHAAFVDAVIIGNEILAGSGTQMVRIDRNTGAELGSWSLPTSNALRALATDGSRLYWLSQGGLTAWGCISVNGGAIWSRAYDLGIDAVEMDVDGAGRPWFIGNAVDGVSPPKLIVTGSDGNAYEAFTYGTSMNDFAMGEDRAYITGRLDDATSTYLIAIYTDITTTVEKPMSQAAFGLFPQPASTSLNVSNAGRIADLIVRDATGQLVQAPLRNNTTLDVSRLSEGIYFLQATTTQGAITRRFVVSR